MNDGVPVVVPGSLDPIDMTKISLKQRALFEVLAEQAEKAEAKGGEGAAFTVTRRMVNAKLTKLKSTKIGVE
jgi:hypothetical protein